MPTATELILQEEGNHLREVATSRGWPLHEVDATRFVISLPAKDGSMFHLLVDCDRYKEQPPAFNWYSPETKQVNQNRDSPRGGNYFHSSGVICAPWNRLAYKQCDQRGPHSDWALASWISNPQTGGTNTLTAMILRLSLELKGPNYHGRMG